MAACHPDIAAMLSAEMHAQSGILSGSRRGPITTLALSWPSDDGKHGRHQTLACRNSPNDGHTKRLPHCGTGGEHRHGREHTTGACLTTAYHITRQGYSS